MFFWGQSVVGDSLGESRRVWTNCQQQFNKVELRRVGGVNAAVPCSCDRPSNTGAYFVYAKLQDYLNFSILTIIPIKWLRRYLSIRVTACRM